MGFNDPALALFRGTPNAVGSLVQGGGLAVGHRIRFGVAWHRSRNCSVQISHAGSPALRGPHEMALRAWSFLWCSDADVGIQRAAVDGAVEVDRGRRSSR